MASPALGTQEPLRAPNTERGESLLEARELLGSQQELDFPKREEEIRRHVHSSIFIFVACLVFMQSSHPRLWSGLHPLVARKPGYYYFLL